MPKFLRRTWYKYSKLGKRRKKLLKWRRPTGRDNKLREKRKNRGPVVSIGYKKNEKTRGLLKGKKPVLVKNIKELERLGKNEIAIIANIGKKKKIEIAEKAKKMNIPLYNLNPNSYLKRIKKENEIKK